MPPKKRTVILTTKNYEMFDKSDENRPTNQKKHRALSQSMKEYGFLECYPIICFRNGKSHLTVKDGQHRLELAESLGLPVSYVETGVDFDVAFVNCTPKVWNPIDYAQKYAQNGSRHYQKGIEFQEKYALPVSQAFALLAGTSSYGNIRTAFTSGKFVVKDAVWADKVASLYVRCVGLSPASLRNSSFLSACIACCRVEEFKTGRFIENAERCRDKLVAYSTRDAYLVMMEDVYNYNRQSMLGLKAAAIMAMRERSAAHKNGKKKLVTAKKKA